MIEAVIGFICTVIVGKFFIGYLLKKQYVQPIYEDAPEEHQKKAGTPTMGAVSFIVPIIIYLVLMLFVNFELAFMLLLVVLGYGYIGFKDDFLKVFHRQNQSGLTPLQKLTLQFLISGAIIVLLFMSGHDTNIYIFNWTLPLGFLYYLFVPVLIVGMSNATNLTDGLDGLLTSITIVTLTTLMILSQVTFISNFLSFVIGCLLAFLLIFNRNPAKMFMGDTGSLVLGALYGVLIVLLKVEFIGIIIGLIYIVEVLSVVVQVSYFKYTKKKTGNGVRIFKMAPLHHHYEKSGLSEKMIVALFGSVQLVISCIVLFLV